MATISENTGLVIANFGAMLAVETSRGKVLRCTTRKELPLVVCGDRIRWQAQTGGGGVVVSLEARRNVLSRPDRRGRDKPLAANFDRLLIVAAPRPPLQRQLLDRYLVLAEHVACDALLVLHKNDLAEYGQPEIQTLRDYYAGLGYPVLSTNARTPDGLTPLREALRSHTGILVGASGVGKSSIIAGLLPDRDVRIGALSASSGLGRHTTTATTLYHLPGGGSLIDSPGIRDFPLENFSAPQIRDGFREFSEFSDRCRFANCMHLNEPECAVRAAVGKQIQSQRWESYRAIVTTVIEGQR
ncbi:MAG: ribosome small subunit-dependent GTPase A [Gammaproteobacteria bacterium]|nr:ribosome small subunit-dependent GTPase A [Gammaproteobacteria bacterium]